MLDVTVGKEKALFPHGDDRQDEGETQFQRDVFEKKGEFPVDDPSHADAESAGEPRIKPLIWFIFALLAYIVLAVNSINAKYVDYGDGNYLYLSWRITQGDILYKELPSPQPPLLLFLGAFLLSLADGDAILVRLWQVIQHCLIACCAWGIAAKVFGRPLISSLAGCIYLFLPEGVWWAAGYQSEPLLILLQSFNVLLLLTAVEQEKSSLLLYAAAVTAALTCFVNMTALPYIALQWFFVWYSFRPFLVKYSVTFLGVGSIFLIGMMIYSQGEYFEHVFFRQVGTYPSESLSMTIGYFLSKLYVEGGDILHWEGGFVLSAVFGLFLYSERVQSTRKSFSDYVLWWAIFSIGSIIFVTKGGTVEYIFTIGEPATAVFSAFFLATILTVADIPTRLRSLRSPRSFGTLTVLICFLLPMLLMKPFSLLYRTFTDGPLVLPGVGVEKPVFEVSGRDMEILTLFIQKQCPPDKLMVSPPYYAFMAKRKIAQNTPSEFIMYMAYLHEWRHLKRTMDPPFDFPEYPIAIQYDRRGREYGYNRDGWHYDTQAVYDLAELFQTTPALREAYPVIDTFLKIREQILNGEVGLVVKSMEHFFYSIPPIHQAIRDFCAPVDPALVPGFYNREEVIEFYKPKG